MAGCVDTPAFRSLEPLLRWLARGKRDNSTKRQPQAPQPRLEARWLRSSRVKRGIALTPMMLTSYRSLQDPLGLGANPTALTW